MDCGPAQSPPRCTKCNSPPINGQCINFILFDLALYVPLHSKELNTQYRIASYLYLDDVEEFHRFDSDVVLDDTIDDSARTQLFTVDALRRVYHSAALVYREVVPVEDSRRRQEAEAQTVDDWRIVATVKAEGSDQVADKTVRRKFLHDVELAIV